MLRSKNILEKSDFQFQVTHLQEVQVLPVNTTGPGEILFSLLSYYSAQG